MITLPTDNGVQQPDDIEKLWGETGTAELGPVPAGKYSATLVDGKFSTSRQKGTPSYKLSFELAGDGPHKGKRCWLDLYLTPNAIARSKAHLAKVGIVQPSQIREPLADRFEVIVQLRIRVGEDQIERNEVVDFTVVKMIERLPFAEAD
jgi:hypothetical protein